MTIPAYEVVIMDDVSEDARQKMEGHLAFEWDIQLPDDHPYNYKRIGWAVHISDEWD